MAFLALLFTVFVGLYVVVLIGFALAVILGSERGDRELKNSNANRVRATTDFGSYVIESGRLYQRTTTTVANIAVRSEFVIVIARIIPVLAILIRACNRDWIRNASKKATTAAISIVQSMLMIAPRLRLSF